MNPIAKVFKSLSIAYLIVTLVLGLAAGAFVLKTKLFIANAIETEGEIVDFIAGRSIHPVIQFETKEGDLISQMSRIGSTPSPFNLNEKVTVFYKEDDPKKFHLNWLPDLWLIPLILSGIAGLFLVLSISFYGVAIIMNRKKAI